MTKCSHCGATSLVPERFCTACGTEIRKEGPLVIPDVERPVRSRRSLWPWVFGAGLVITAVSAAVLLLVSQKHEPRTAGGLPPSLSVPVPPKGQRGAASVPTSTPAGRAPAPQATRTVIVEPPPAPPPQEPERDARLDLDPCDGGDFPFSDQLELVTQRPTMKGAREIAIENVQVILRDIGYERPNGKPLVADGWYGPETEAAVLEFQGRHGLDETGTVFIRTWPILGEIGAEQGAC